jgi:hypothetical protein
MSVAEKINSEIIQSEKKRNCSTKKNGIISGEPSL